MKSFELYLRRLGKIFVLVKEASFVFYDAFILHGRKKKLIFFDLGANLGQGFRFFSAFYDRHDPQYILYEPNPNCYSKLIEDAGVIAKRASVHEQAAGVRNGTVEFFGLSEAEGGAFSQGGSIVKGHNSLWYETSRAEAISVETIDFSQRLSWNDVITAEAVIVKMDIEGAEIDLLRHLLSTGAAKMISVLYVEFHSKYRKSTERGELEEEEKLLVSELSELGVRVRIWH